MSCSICLEDLSSPVSLPCGHVFCHECLKRAVQAIQPYSTLHACPTCRAHYFISPLDLSSVPQQLRPHLTPSIRRVYLDLPPKPEKAATSCPPSPELSRNLSIEVARLRAENDALRHNCVMWRKRAEVHSSATLGLLELSRTARDQVMQVTRQRDTIRRDYLRLNHDYQRQRTVLQAVVTAMPQPALGAPGQTPRPQVLVNKSIPLYNGSVSPSATFSFPASSRSCPTDERNRKRLRTEDDSGDDSGSLLLSRPSKIIRRVETDSFVGRDMAQDPLTPVGIDSEAT